MVWRIELLGGLRAVRVDHQGGAAITRFTTRKTGLLLAFLAYHRDRAPAARDTLVELLWPESDATDGRQSLSRALSSLRPCLEPPGVATGSVLASDRLAIGLNAEAVTTDVVEFDGALRKATAAAETERVVWLFRAVECYQGELLSGYHDGWILQEREWRAERFFQAARELAGLLEGKHDFDAALEVNLRAVRIDPLREDVHRELIRLFAAAGQPARALRQYHELARCLREELGGAPSTATRALVSRIEQSSGVDAADERASKDTTASLAMPCRPPFPPRIPEPRTRFFRP